MRYAAAEGADRVLADAALQRAVELDEDRLDRMAQLVGKYVTEALGRAL